MDSVPLFPLGSVLFPGGLLPLRIFEVRYLNMISKCHQSGQPFGVVALSEGTEVRQAERSSGGFAPEAFHRVGTLAQITELTRPQPGLLMVRCTGLQRFTVQRSEQLKHGLWTADVALLPADMAVTVPPDLRATADALAQLLQTLQERAVPDEQMPLLTPYQLQDCGWVANRWCELLPVPVELKQQLMALDNPLVRLELVSDLLDRSGLTA